jgi:hypothetical protein
MQPGGRPRLTTHQPSEAGTGVPGYGPVRQCFRRLANLSQNGHVLGHDYEFALNFSSGSADLLVVVCISHKVAKPDGTFRWLVPCPELGHW